MPSTVKIPGPCHLPSAGALESLSLVGSWMMDKVESFHPSSGYTQNFLWHGALGQSGGMDLLPLHTMPTHNRVVIGQTTRVGYTLIPFESQG